MENILAKALHVLKNGRSCAFATIVESTPKGTPRKSGAKMVVLEDGRIIGSIGGGRNELAARNECLKAIQTGKSIIITYDYFGQKGQSVCGGQIKIFIEPFIGTKRLIICGAGHIALPISFIGKLLNYHVTILDNRKEYANSKRFPHVDAILLGNHAHELEKINITSQSLIMIVTQGNEFDYECLRTVIKSPAGYLGVISSKAKRIKFFKRLKEEGISDKLLKRVKIPAGIDIGAQTPEEIAVSIIAEIIKIQNNLFIGSAKFKVKD